MNILIFFFYGYIFNCMLPIDKFTHQSNWWQELFHIENSTTNCFKPFVDNFSNVPYIEYTLSFQLNFLQPVPYFLHDLYQYFNNKEFFFIFPIYSKHFCDFQLYYKFLPKWCATFCLYLFFSIIMPSLLIFLNVWI